MQYPILLGQRSFRIISTAVLCMTTVAILSSGRVYAEGEVRDPAQRWNDFKRNHHKSYHDGNEDESRFRIFKNNLTKIDQLNDEHEKQFGNRPFGVNQFSDLEPSEFATGYLTFSRSRENRDIDPPNLTHLIPRSRLPVDLDWSKQGVTTAVKDQGNCGSCWAFSAIEQLETAIYMSTGTLPLLSAQQVTSCSTGDGGCNGGDPVSAYGYMIQAGVQSESSYPYTSGRTGSTGSCQYNSANVAAKMTGWQYGVSRCKTSSCSDQVALEPTLQQVVASQGPASVCLNATSWQYYSGGVLGSSCAGDWNSMNHCVQLVGYNTSSSGTPYWLLRNQWGTSWGMSGFIQLKMGSNVCGVANEVTYVKVASPSPIPSPTPSPTITPAPSPTITPSPIPTPTPTVTPTPSPSPTVSPGGRQEMIDFRSTSLGRSTVCSGSMDPSAQSVVCQTQLTTGVAPKSVSDSQLIAALATQVAMLRSEVMAIRPDYYSSLTCALDLRRTRVYRRGKKGKIAVGVSVCQH